MSQVDV